MLFRADRLDILLYCNVSYTACAALHASSLQTSLHGAILTAGDYVDRGSFTLKVILALLACRLLP
jgi:hypothetical protein